MDRRTLAVVTLSVTFCLVSPVTFGQTAASSGQKLDERVTLAFEKASAPDILGFLARFTGYPAVIDPALQQKLSFRLERVKVRTALDALCDSLGCRWRLEGNRLVFEAVPSGEPKLAEADSDELLAPIRKVVPPGTQFNAVALSSALQTLSQIAGPDVELTVGMVDASQTVSADVSSKTIQSAIRQLVAATGASAGKQYSITINRPGRLPTKIMTVLPGTDIVLQCEILKDADVVARPVLRGASGKTASVSYRDEFDVKVTPTWLDAHSVRLQVEIQAGGKTYQPLLSISETEPGSVTVDAGKSAFTIRFALGK